MKKSITVLSALLFVLGLSSGAFAANALLTGDDIKNGSLSGVDVKKGSLGPALFTAAAKNSLRGTAGADGADGATGATGPTGVAGLAGTNGAPGIDGDDGAAGLDGNDGTITPLVALQGMTALPTATPPTVVVELTVPAGRYVILAKTQLYHSGAGDSVTCELKAGSSTIDQIAMKTLPALAQIPVSLQAVTTTIGSTTTLTVQCDVSVADGTANYSSLIAIPSS